VLPFGAIGYRRLPGQSCQPSSVTPVTGRQLGFFLAALHGADPAALAALPSADQVWHSWHRLREDLKPILLRRLTARENQCLDAWWRRFLGDQRMRRYRPAVRHGDLWYGNILIHPGGAVSAVLDWEMIAFADPSQDLALARYLGPEFTAAMLDAYLSAGGAYDRETEHRADRHWELRELTGIPLARALDDDKEITECIAKLRAGPIFS
jgi:aminoglycoside phosphotransferase (APT) family kinase protein